VDRKGENFPVEVGGSERNRVVGDIWPGLGNLGRTKREVGGYKDLERGEH